MYLFFNRKKKLFLFLTVVFLSVFLIHSIGSQDTSEKWAEQSRFEYGEKYVNSENPDQFKVVTHSDRQYKDFNGEWKKYEQQTTTRGDVRINHVYADVTGISGTNRFVFFDETSRQVLEKEIIWEQEISPGVWEDLNLTFGSAEILNSTEEGGTFRWNSSSRQGGRAFVILRNSDGNFKWIYEFEANDNVNVRALIKFTPLVKMDSFSEATSRGVNGETTIVKWKYDEMEGGYTYNFLDWVEQGIVDHESSSFTNEEVLIYGTSISLSPGENISIDPSTGAIQTSYGVDSDGGGKYDGDTDWVGNGGGENRASRKFPLPTGGSQIPIGSTIDQVDMTTWVDSAGATQDWRAGAYGGDGYTSDPEADAVGTFYPNCVVATNEELVTTQAFTSTGEHVFTDMNENSDLAQSLVSTAVDAEATFFAVAWQGDNSVTDGFTELNQITGGDDDTLTITYTEPSSDTEPTVTLHAPADSTGYTSAQTIDFQANVSDNFAIQNVTFYWNVSGSWITNGTNSSGINGTTYTFSRPLSSTGDFIWNVLACDNSSQCAFASANRSFSYHQNSLDIISPSTGSPVSVNDGDNITIQFNYSVDGTNQTSGVSIEDVFIGGSQATILGGEGESGFKNSSSDTGDADGEDISLTVPLNAVEGDLMVVVILNDDNAPAITLTPPTNETWTAEQSAIVMGTQATSPSIAWIYSKNVSAEDEALAGTKAYTWSFGGDEEGTAWLGLYHPANFGQFSDNPQTGTGTSAIAPSIDTQVADEIVLFVAYMDGNAGFTSPTGDGEVERFQGSSGVTGDGGGTLALVERTFINPPNTTGTRTFTLTSNERSGFTFSLQPTAEGQQYGFVNGAWEVNVTVPSLGSVGLQDLFVNATFSSITVNDTETNAVQYPGGQTNNSVSLIASLSLTQTLGKLSEGFRTLTDNIFFTLTLDFVRDIFQDLSDSITFTTQITKIGNLFRTITDGILFNLNFNSLRSVDKFIQDTFTFSDEPNFMLGITRTITDTFSFTLDLFRSLLGLRNISDTVTFTSGESSLQNLLRSLQDNVQFTSVINTLRSVEKGLTDSIAFSLSIFKNFLGLRSVDDSISFDSETNFLRGVFTSLTDTFTFSLTLFTQNIEAGFDTFSRVISDSFSFTLNIFRGLFGFRTASDSISFDSSMNKVRDTFRGLTDTITFSAQMSKVSSFFRTLTDSIIYLISIFVPGSDVVVVEDGGGGGFPQPGEIITLIVRSNDLWCFNQENTIRVETHDSEGFIESNNIDVFLIPNEYNQYENQSLTLIEDKYYEQTYYLDSSTVSQEEIDLVLNVRVSNGTKVLEEEISIRANGCTSYLDKINNFWYKLPMGIKISVATVVGFLILISLVIFIVLGERVTRVYRTIRNRDLNKEFLS